jgi:hypothetical protein
MNGIIWQAIYNVVNSYSMMEMESFQAKGTGKASTHAPEDMFVGRVRILEDTVLAVQKPDSLYQKTLQEDKSEDAFEQAHLIYKALLALLQRNGHLRFKPPRDFADE